jgi:hypothetical protein
MTCFSVEEWVDYARKTLCQESMIQMQRHLRDGCPKCIKTSSIWRVVLILATRELSYQPPESAVRFVKESLGRSLQSKFSLGQAMLPTLIFDSFRQPAPAGVHASQFNARQILYSAGDDLIDVRLEGGSNRLSLAGQVLNSGKPRQALECLPVALLRRGEPIAQTITSPFGEFEFEFETGKDVRLAIGFDAESSVVIPLEDVKPPVGLTAS